MNFVIFRLEPEPDGTDVFVLPGYDQRPVVHDRDSDDSQPVVVSVTSRINHCDFLRPGHIQIIRLSTALSNCTVNF